MSAPINGLVLAGGFSRRMGRDKALLDYHGVPQARWTGRLVAPVCDGIYYSCREGQDLGAGPDLSAVRIHDIEEGGGPIEGMLSAHKRDPHSAWLVIACDLPRLTIDTVQHLIENRDTSKLVTAYRSFHDGLPEPLCALYEPAAFPHFLAFYDDGRKCPRRLLIDLGEQINLLDLPDGRALDNANTPDEASEYRMKPASN
jgi:molybdopterin-guanine dinucleotide biosynthesis protein A